MQMGLEREASPVAQSKQIGGRETIAFPASANVGAFPGVLLSNR